MRKIVLSIFKVYAYITQELYLFICFENIYLCQKKIAHENGKNFFFIDKLHFFSNDLAMHKNIE